MKQTRHKQITSTFLSLLCKIPDLLQLEIVIAFFEAKVTRKRGQYCYSIHICTQYRTICVRGTLSSIMENIDIDSQLGCFNASCN